MTGFFSSRNPAPCDLSFTVNGEMKTVRAYPMERLLDVLRHQLELSGAKEGCGEGECGSCSVLLNGALVNSCLLPVLQAQGADIVTIEGLAPGPQLDRLQEAFLTCGGAQCGICTPGMILAAHPGGWLPIAGGTDVMVQYAAGKLPARKLVSIWNLPELRRMEVLPDEIRIGAGCTYTELREHNVIAREFPLLASAARWTGGIANQNRGTLGGNIVNASPAADSLPALLVYEAELILVSRRGERRVPY